MTGAGGPDPAPASDHEWPQHELLRADLGHALFERTLAKPVHASLVLDDMESDRGWQASPALELGYTTERSRSGTRSLRLAFDQRNEEYIRQARSANGSFTGEAVVFEIPPFAAAAHLRLAEPQDWSSYNRISLWCFVHPTGNPATALSLSFLCEGAPTGPADPIAIHYFSDLREGEWNHLVWEISEFPRDRVIDVGLFHPTWGLNLSGAENRRTFDLDALELQVVDAEQVEGWGIRDGAIAYSHIGYPAHGEKVALVGERIEQFRLVDATGDVVATLPAVPVVTRRGSFSRLDLTSVTPGRYQIEAGAARSEPFPISAEPWRGLVGAVLNGLYALRCGFAVPGVQDACHLDHRVVHEGDARIVGGGWHDAANLSQTPINTHLTAIALLDLAEAIAPVDPRLAERALEEARWGLEWIRRMRFGPGLRYLFGGYSYYSDGIQGTADDVVEENVGFDRFLVVSGALAEARGARALLAADPALAAELLREAEEDYRLVRETEPPVEEGEPDWQSEPWQNEIGYLALLATELAGASGSIEYAEDAARFGRFVLDLQETRFVDGLPVTGYFDEDAARTRILHEGQRTSGAPHSFEDGAPLALQTLCDAFPDHPDWIRWYAGLVAYSEFACRTGAQGGAPFDLLPAAIWREADLDGPMDRDEVGESIARHASALFPTPPTPDVIRPQLRELYEAGTPLADGQRLRTFPLHVDHVRHGSTAVQLTKAMGLAAGAQVRNLPALSDLLAQQVHWLTGLNPFSRSLVYGVGHDWWQNFTVSLPNVVGFLSVGMNTYRDDAPAWGNNTVFPYKEVWVVSMARLAGVLARLPGRAAVRGTTRCDAVFQHALTGERTVVPAGPLDLAVAPGEYELEFGGMRRRLSLADGTRTVLDLDPDHAIDLRLTLHSPVTGGSGMTITARGFGSHTIDLRADNLRLPTARLELDLDGGIERVIDLALSVVDPERPWVLVAVPNGAVTQAEELVGSAIGPTDLSRP